MMIGRFYNKMPFTIPLRKVWVPGSPAITLEAGGIIEGPTEILSQFSFLAPLSFDFAMVDSTTQNSKFDFKDERIKEISKPVINNDTEKQNVEIIKKPVEQPTIVEKPIVIGKDNESAPEVKVEEVKTTVQDDDFDPLTVNWLMVKVSQLETKCKKLNIDISFLADKKPKDRKWELVKLVKQYYKI